MNNEYIESVIKQVRPYFGEDEARFAHSLSVADTAACLAYAVDADAGKAYIAGILHDCAKCIADDKLITICREHNLSISEYELKSPYLLHGKVGALYAKKYFGINDAKLLDAITYHTTGRPAMTDLEEIVFLADYIEPLRNKAANLDIVRKMAFKDIKMAIYIVTKDTLDYLNANGKMTDPLTSDTFKYYENICGCRMD